MCYYYRIFVTKMLRKKNLKRLIKKRLTLHNYDQN